MAWVTDAFLAGEKTVTRRRWKPHYIAGPSMMVGSQFKVVDRSIPPKGTKSLDIGVIQLTEPILWEWFKDIPESDFEAEGFGYYERHPQLHHRLPPSRLQVPRCRWDFDNVWRTQGGGVYVVRFTILDRMDHAKYAALKGYEL